MRDRPLVATLKVTRDTGKSRSASSELGLSSASWTIADYGEVIGFTKAVSDAYLLVPDWTPDTIVGLLVVGGEDFQYAVLPWFGELHSPRGAGGAVIGITEENRIGLRMHQDVHPREIRVVGADTPLEVGEALKLFVVIF